MQTPAAATETPPLLGLRNALMHDRTKDTSALGAQDGVYVSVNVPMEMYRKWAEPQLGGGRNMETLKAEMTQQILRDGDDTEAQSMVRAKPLLKLLRETLEGYTLDDSTPLMLNLEAALMLQRQGVAVIKETVMKAYIDMQRSSGRVSLTGTDIGYAGELSVSEMDDAMRVLPQEDEDDE